FNIAFGLGHVVCIIIRGCRGEGGDKRRCDSFGAAVALGVRRRCHAISRRVAGNSHVPRYNPPLYDSAVRLAAGHAAALGPRCGSLDFSCAQDCGAAGSHLLLSRGACRATSSNFPYRREPLQSTTSRLLICSSAGKSQLLQLNFDAVADCGDSILCLRGIGSFLLVGAQTWNENMTLQRRHIVMGAVVALAVVIAATVLMHSLGDASARKSDEPTQRVAPVVLVARSPLENTITLTGEFRPFQQVDVHAKVAGYIRQIFVDVGDKVRAGQALAILEVPELNAQVMGAKADIRRSQDAIRRAQSEIERAESTH